ncbi:MAG: tetratricopeptide repeat protein [Casimicrobiaceae bacterium]
MMDSAGGLSVLGPRMESRVADDPADANALLDLSTLVFFTANPDMRAFALEYQRRALQLRQVYRLAPPANPARLELLVLMAPGDMTSNTPADCLLEGADIDVTLVYVLPDRPLPTPLPRHDVIFVAIGESGANQVLLRQLRDLPRNSAKPVVNAPDRIARLTRDRVSELLSSVPGVAMPATVLADRESLLKVQRREMPLHEVMAGGRFPLIVRPPDSQGGKDLVKIDSVEELSAYLVRLPNEGFYISNFIDYRSQDGQFRKYRVVLVDGRSFACHLAISTNWMIHYVNADMDASAEKRQEEARFFADFEIGFAARHRQSLQSIHDLLGLDYFGIDCAETSDGKLLVFEADNAAIVHAFDDAEMYPYKPPAMQKIFAAFRAMLAGRARGAESGQPGTAVAHCNLANALAEQGKLDQAVESYLEALSLRPDYWVAHFNLGNVLRDQGNLDEALASYRKTIALKPDFAEAHNNAGLVLQAQGRRVEAVDNYRKAISLNPGLGVAHNNLALALSELGQLDTAVASYQRALELDQAPAFKANFVQCIKNHVTIENTDSIRRLVVRAISESWAWKSELIAISTRLIKADEDISDCIERASSAWPERLSGDELFGPAGIAALSSDPLLRAVLENFPVADVALERCLTMARQALLDAAIAGEDPPTDALAFYSALAQQCFINEYIFSPTDKELARAQSLRGKLVAALAFGNAVPEYWIAAVASYFPLLSIPGSDALLHRSYPDSVVALLTQQIAEPLEERGDRVGMPMLTAIEAGVSSAVRQQYEENPYPRWVKLPPPGKALIIDLDLRKRFPRASFRPLGKGGDIDVLIAGCGTGGESIDLAQNFPGARLLAVDLSLSSLCYAKRKTRAAGLKNIEYAQADIMKIRSIGRTFDVISSVGVLHHLADPLAGLRELLSLLRPGGFMRLGLYSQCARREVVAARQHILKRGYTPSPEDIRRCRQDLMTRDTEFAHLSLSGDFYSMSECRDLLFHVQEHRFTLPQIKEALQNTGLEFIGFTLDPRVIRNYAERHGDDAAQTDLDSWHRFETAFPDTFAGMYRFWVQKLAA